jgi:iron complex outermembrane recepter protein
MIKGCSKSLLLLGTALNLIGPATAHAADTGVAAGADDVEQIVVTARRREERLQDVPISITVFNQQQLSNNNVINASDLATYTPSLQVNTDFGSQNSSFAIRGFVQDPGTAPSVGVFFADVVAPRGATQEIQAGDGAGPGDFFDLQNVQVLKGPQGTLFGRNTTGGNILLVPQKPTDEFGGYVEGSFGNYDYLGGQGVINVPVNDQIRLRFGIDHESRDGYINNTSGVGPSDFDDVNYTALRASADIDITPDLEDYIVATYSHSDTNGDFQKMIACDPHLSSNTALLFATFANSCNQVTPGKPGFQGSGFYDGAQSLPDPSSKLTIWRVINTTTWSASDDLTVKNIASYAQLQDDFINPIFGTNFHTAAGPGGLPSFPVLFAADTPLPGNLPTANQATFTEEPQILGKAWDNRLTWQAGAYLEGSVPLSVFGAQNGVLADCTNPTTFDCYDAFGELITDEGIVPKGTAVGKINSTAGLTTTNDYALYTQETYALTDELKLTGGYRYTWDRMANTSREITYDVGYPLALNGSSPPYQVGGPLPAMVTGANCTNPTAPGYQAAGYGTGPVPASACVVKLKELSNAPTWLLDLDYTPADDVLIYAKWARGYRQGIINEGIQAPYDIAGPEKVDDYEGGFKTSYEFAGVSGTFDADGFYNDFRNQQLLLGFNGNPCYQVVNGTCIPSPVGPAEAAVNAAKSRIAGAELDATLVPYEGMSFQLGYTYLATDILASRQFASPPGSLYQISGPQKPGDVLPLAPKDKVSFTAAYTLPVDDSIGKITLSATFVHTDSMLTSYADAGLTDTVNGKTVPSPLAGLGTLPPTNILDININWNQVLGKPIDLSFFATNVTGDQYYTYVAGLGSSVGFEVASLGAPTFYGVRIRYHFGDD